MVAPADEHLGSAVKRAGKVQAAKGLRSEAQKARSLVAKRLDALTKELTVPLGVYVKGFPALDRLHPFERTLVELTLGAGVYERALERVNRLRIRLLEQGKRYAGQAKGTGSKKEALSLLETGSAALEQMYRKDAAAVDKLKYVAMALRRLPVVELDVPTVALVGAPNVGKSSLVQFLSSGKPEINNYPFTTKGIKMGHFFVEDRRHQVTDTPGLLPRSSEARNSIEALTIASLEHLPTAVLFVLDLTGESGTLVEDQLSIRAELKGRFGDKAWLDVVSKKDLLDIALDPEVAEFGDKDAQRALRELPAALLVSTAGDGEGIGALMEAMQAMMSRAPT